MQLICACLFFLFHQLSSAQEPQSYSFFKFSGPVSGQIEEIAVEDPVRNEQTVDYVAKPDYAYSFGVQDPYTGNSHGRQESRDGDTVRGQYTVLQSDGNLRIVKYTADGKNGFQATVEYEPQSGAGGRHS